MTTSHEGFFGELVTASASTHAETLGHPFVRGIGAGDLPDEGFRAYLEQDYQFLVRYLRVIALAVAASPDTATMQPLAELLHSTLAVEIDGLHALYAQFGGDPKRLDGIEPQPACRAYTDHLLRVALQQDLLVTLAAMLPCQWGYGDIGRVLMQEGLPKDERFAGWVREYASDDYNRLVEWVIARLNALAEQAGVSQLDAARDAFRVSAAYELGFWQMAWTLQREATPSLT